MGEETQTTTEVEDKKTTETQDTTGKEVVETTKETAAISEDQATKLKEDITKDVSGRVSEEVSKSVLTKIAEALGLSKKEETALPTNAEQLQKLIDQKVQEKIDNLSKEATQEETQAETDRQERIDSIIAGWHSQYDFLAKSGKVPKIVDPNNKDDKGVQARRRIIIAIGKMIDENKNNGSTYTPTASDVLIAYPNILKGPPGGDLPISGATVSQEETARFSNKEIRGKSINQIARDGSS